jgi:hypothetical protein
MLRTPDPADGWAPEVSHPHAIASVGSVCVVSRCPTGPSCQPRDKQPCREWQIRADACGVRCSTIDRVVPIWGNRVAGSPIPASNSAVPVCLGCEIESRSPYSYAVPEGSERSVAGQIHRAALTIVALLAPGAPPDHPDHARGGIEEDERSGTSNSASPRRVHRSAVVGITRIAVSRYMFVRC